MTTKTLPADLAKLAKDTVAEIMTAPDPGAAWNQFAELFVANLPAGALPPGASLKIGPPPVYACGEVRPEYRRPDTIGGLLPCITPAGHDGDHADSLGGTWAKEGGGMKVTGSDYWADQPEVDPTAPPAGVPCSRRGPDRGDLPGWLCDRPAGHDGDHRDCFGGTWAVTA